MLFILFIKCKIITNSPIKTAIFGAPERSFSLVTDTHLKFRGCYSKMTGSPTYCKFIKEGQ